MIRNMKTDINNWLYLKSDNPADALALATVISYSSDFYNIVRRTVNAYFYSGLKNVTIDFFSNTEQDNLIVIEEINNDSWQEKCDILAHQLNISIPNKCLPYLGFSVDCSNIIEQWGEDKCVLLYLLPHPDQKLDLMVVDQIVRLFERKGIKSVSGGALFMPCIKGTRDFRQLINLSLLCNIKDLINFILTTENFMKTIGEALGINVYVISHVLNLMIDGIPMEDANQIVNYISMFNNKK